MHRCLGAHGARWRVGENIGKIDADTRIASEITELDAVVAFVVGRAPFVAQAQIERELRVNFPVVLEVKTGLSRSVRD